MADFLLEIGTEEIPARMITPATEELIKRMRDLVERERLSSAAEFESFSTPRRIAVLVRGIGTSQPDVEEQLTGPSAQIAFKDGLPTKAAEAFARKAGIDISQVQKISTPKGEYIAATVTKKGRSTTEILAEALPREIAGIYWAKNMYWRPGKPERFVRPMRWLVALLDSEVVPVEFGGITAGNKSRGHRILSEGDVIVSKPVDYSATLEKASVVSTYAAREYKIRKALDAATRKVSGARWREDKALLDMVVNLTEFPTVILGSFEKEYLTLPEEVLVTVMRDHQKYFAVEDENGTLAPYFLAVLNTNGDPDGLIRHGNERVLRARFNDARFFWNTDQKITLRERVDMLKNVTFQKDLGSYHAKTMRVQKLASLLSETVKSTGIAIRPGIVHKAALMAKTDLTTELVKEFTELQGIIGGLYAKAQAKTMEINSLVGDVVYDQYKPESMDDDVPQTVEGAVLAIADKADTIAGMFALGLVPSGSKDPFALRRAANGIVKIIAEHKLPIRLSSLFKDARMEYNGSEAESKFVPAAETQTALFGFLRERLEFYLRDVRGYAYDVVNAVLSSGADDVVDALQRAEAVARVRGSDDFSAISAAFKRIKNILRQAGISTTSEVGQVLAYDVPQNAEPAEKILGEVALEFCGKAPEYLKQKQYDDVLSAMAKIRKPLDSFFDAVMVMAEDEKTRASRLALLRLLAVTFSYVADFSEIVTEGK